MAPLRDRTSPEIVVLILAATLGVLLVASVVFVGVIELTQPETDTAVAISSITNTITLLCGAVVGYLAGRVARDRENRP
jgi:uncharacterized oligopeptide transporter (OPT) family protein